jgi:hypothetical protein
MMAIIYPALSVMTHGSVMQFTLAQMAFAVPIGMHDLHKQLL